MVLLGTFNATDFFVDLTRSVRWHISISFHLMTWFIGNIYFQIISNNQLNWPQVESSQGVGSSGDQEKWETCELIFKRHSKESEYFIRIVHLVKGLDPGSSLFSYDCKIFSTLWSLSQELMYGSWSYLWLSSKSLNTLVQIFYVLFKKK